MFDKRRSHRRRTLLDGRIQVAKLNGWAVDCTIRDVGAGGVSLVLPVTTIIPDVFHLGVSDRGAEPARLVWYRAGRAGVELMGRPGTPPLVAYDGAAMRSSQWDGRCRRMPTSSPSAAPVDRFAARIAAISSRRPFEDRRRAT